MKALLLAALTLTLPAFGQQKIKKIKVAPLVSYESAGQPYANMITAKLMSYLVKDGVTVIENDSDSDADAVLAVTYQLVTLPDSYGNVAHVRFTGAVRLTDKDGEILWADEVRNRPFVQSASSGFAENVAKKVSAFLASQK